MKKIIVYHGTSFDFDAIDLTKSKDRRDFGKGFYTTTIQSQAEAWAKNIALRNGMKTCFVYVYEFTFDDSLKHKHFDGLNEEWLEFIKENRSKGGLQHEYDVVIGPVADDNTMETIQLYISGILNAKEAVERLRYNKVNNQISFHTERALGQLKQIRRQCYE